MWVPAATASIADINAFALTYSGYDLHDGFSRLAHLANGCAADWHAKGELPDQVDQLRVCLFFEVRRWHHFGYEMDASAEA